MNHYMPANQILDKTNKFLGTHKLLKLAKKKKEKKNFNKPVTSKQIDLVIKNFPEEKTPGPDDFFSEFY